MKQSLAYLGCRSPAVGFDGMARDFNSEYDDLMDELEAIIAEGTRSGVGAGRTRTIRTLIETLLREQLHDPAQAGALTAAAGESQTRH